MNISTRLKNISPHTDKPSGGYEWWYFDGLDKTGELGFVIIFYHGNPFSTRYIKDLEKSSVIPGKYPALSISFYKDKKPFFYSFTEFVESDYSWNEEEGRLKIAGSQFTLKESAGRLRYEILLEQQLPSGHSIRGKLNFESESPNPELIAAEGDDRHIWNLLQARAHVEADLHINNENLVFTGTGYHDHNTGQEPMKESFRDWYWGRYHFPDSTLIYYIMNGHEGDEHQAWLIDKESQQVLEEFDNIRTTYYTLNPFLLSSARKIELSTENSEILIQNSAIVDNGMYYQRFIGQSVLKRKGKIKAAQGFAEYIRPDRIYKRLFWPLVHMRLRYESEEPHWVQKSGLFYPWTW